MFKPTKPTVLVTIADQDTRLVIVQMLKELGARVLETNSFGSAIAEVLRHDCHVDLLISDPYFVDGSAIQLSHELEQRGHAGRAILLCMTRCEFAGTKLKIAQNIRSLLATLKRHRSDDV